MNVATDTSVPSHHVVPVEEQHHQEDQRDDHVVGDVLAGPHAVHELDPAAAGTAAHRMSNRDSLAQSCRNLLLRNHCQVGALQARSLHLEIADRVEIAVLLANSSRTNSVASGVECT